MFVSYRLVSSLLLLIISGTIRGAQCDCMWHLEWTAPTMTEGGAPIEGTITYDVYEDGRLLIADVQPIPPNDWTAWAWPVVYGNGKCWTVRSVIHLPMDTAVPPYTDIRLQSVDSNQVCVNNEQIIPQQE